MKDIKEFLKVGTQQSSMRLMSMRAVNTACFVSVFAIVGAVTSLILCVTCNKDLVAIGAVIGALLGGTAGIVGTLLLPAFGGKAAQSKFEQENQNKEEEK